MSDIGSDEDTCSKSIPEVRVVSDSDKIQILMHEVRREILAVMKNTHSRKDTQVSDWSVKELSQVMEISPQRIYHHMDKLLEGGFVYKCREQKINRSVTSYYRRSAKRYVIDYEKETPEVLELLNVRGKELVRQIVNWYDIELSDEEIHRLEELFPNLLSVNGIVMGNITAKLKEGYNPIQFPLNIRFLTSILTIDDGHYLEALRELNDILGPKFKQ